MKSEDVSFNTYSDFIYSWNLSYHRITATATAKTSGYNHP